MANKIKLRYLLTGLGVWLVTLITIAQPHYKIIDYAKLNDRVTTVNRIVRDNHGMMWFASDDGLYRYDGYEFINFKSRSGDGTTMPSNRINSMFNSSEGGIWCLISGRPFLFDTRSCRFVDVLSDFEQREGHTYYIRKLRALPCGTTWLFAEDGSVLALEDAQPTQSIRLMAEQENPELITVVCDSLQRSWVLTDKHTYLYHKEKLTRFNQSYRYIIVNGHHIWLLDDHGQVAMYHEKSKKITPWHHSLLDSHVGSMSMLTDGRMALSCDKQLLLASADSKKVRTTQVTWPVRKVMEDAESRLWILANDGTLSLSDKNGNNVTQVAGILSKEKCDIMSDPHGNVWIFTANGDTYYATTDNLTHPVRYLDDDMHINITNTIADGQGGYWFIHKYHAYRLTFESPHYRHLPLHENCQVRCIAVDSKKRLLVCSRYDESITVFSPAGQRLGWLGRDGRIHQEWVNFGSAGYSSYLTPDGTLWLGTKKDGLLRLRPTDNDSYQISRYVKEDKESIPDNEIYGIVADAQHRLWIGTHKGGLCCMADYRADKPRFITTDNGLKGWNTDRNTSIRSLLILSPNRLLVGTFGGLYVADISSRNVSDITFKVHRREANREESLSSSNITDILRTSDGRIFLSTPDGGINELLTSDLMADQLSFRHYNLSTGFPVDITHAIMEYGKSLWTVAPNQLVEMKLKQSQMPGINSFLMRENPHFSSCKPAHLEKGKWVMGADDGALLVNLDELRNSPFVPPLVVTGVSKENSPIDHTAVWGDSIQLSSNERNLTIWFSALDYEDTELVSYAYRIGDSKDWTYIGQNHSITLAQMQPGDYEITIRSTNSNGAWCNNERTLTITVQPTFWETIWGKLLIALMVIGIGCIITYTVLYIRRIKRQQHETMEAYLALLTETKEKDTTSESETAPVSQPNIPEEDEELMRKMMTFIENNLSNSDITIDDMATAIAVSKSGLHRKVKTLLGTSPMEFLREARIRKATQMLKESSKSVSEIAYQCGFSDPKYFSKCFKASTGQTPSEYKAML